MTMQSASTWHYVEAGQPALDVGCGTGRLLLPLPPRRARRRWLRHLARHARPLPLRGRVLDFDPLDQSVTIEMQAFMSRDGELVAQEEQLLTMRLYFRNELVLMLENAGFSAVEVRGDHNDAEPTGDDDFLVFVARKAPA